MKIVNVVGARPNFMKIAPLMEEYADDPSVEALLVHTGQHYDEKMSDLFFRQLGIPEPNINLGIGSGSHAVQTAEIMKGFETVVLDHRPDAVLVVGDVNSTIACGLVAVKLGVKLIHVEAGLRSGDRSMPEEINRVLTDSISDLLFCTEQSGVDNLAREGIAPEKVHMVGHVMIDTLLKNLERAKSSTIVDQLRQEGWIDGEGCYAMLTLHRPSNVDNATTFGQILDALEQIQQDLPILFPIHPRTQKNLGTLGLQERIDAMENIHLMEPIGYLDFLKLNSCAKVVFTDSGGIQEETTALKIPCITLRESTERPVTAEIGSNQIVGTDPQKILAAYEKTKSGHWREPRIPPLWDGKAAERIVRVIKETIVCESEQTV